MILRPMFSFFGSKWRIAKHYPEPKYDTIIEPFCGSAGYSLHYPERQVILNDLDPYVVGVWNYLLRASEKEIISLPDIKEHIDEVSYLHQEAQWLIQFWLTKGTGRPRKTLSRWARDKEGGVFWGEKVRQRVAAQLQYIRHWTVYHGSYEDLDKLSVSSEPATFFVDAPYCITISKEYTYNKINYDKLASWCKNRNGQIIVAEKLGATWLPFDYLINGRTSHNKKISHEVIWHYQRNYN